MKKIFSVIVLAGFVTFISDRFFKHIFLQNPNASWDFVFSWHLSKNYGIAFNISLPLTLVIIVTALVILLLVKFLIDALRNKNFFNAGFLALIIFGAFSNLFDRIQYGYVIDYIDVPYFTILNLADVMITIGAILILVKEIFFKKETRN